MNNTRLSADEALSAGHLQGGKGGVYIYTVTITILHTHDIYVYE